jgi:hypothetical protein
MNSPGRLRGPLLGVGGLHDGLDRVAGSVRESVSNSSSDPSEQFGVGLRYKVRATVPVSERIDPSERNWRCAPPGHRRPGCCLRSMKRAHFERAIVESTHPSPHPQGIL